MGLMNAFDSQTEDSSPAIGRNLRSRPLARKKLSEMVEEELEQMIRRREFGEGALPDWGCRLWRWAVMPATWSA